MASANVSLSEEQFFCSICLEVFTEPVSTPCGHNYCKLCIADSSQCLLCKESFRAPELRVNAEFRDMLEVFKRTTGDSSPARPGEVPCDLCTGMKHKAVKSCLVCLVSYCNTHLKPHHTVQALKWHKLINPVETLENRVCKKHNKVIEFFCTKDQSCICVVCLKDGHEMHQAVSLEEEFKDRKTKLKRMKRKVNRTLKKKYIMTQRIQNSVEQVQQQVERMKAETVKAFAGLVASIETKKVKLIELLEEKQRAADQQAQTIIRQLKLEIVENRRTSTKLEELSKAEDDFRLLQGLPSVSSPSNATRPFSVQHLPNEETVRSAVAKMEETLSEQMENIIREVNLFDEGETVEEQIDTQSENLFDDELGKIQKQYATKVTLDHNTAHPSLILSDDRKRVRDGGAKRKVPYSPTRFESLHFVFGDQGFSSGRFYYEVLLEGQTGWEVGVARDSINRKSLDLSLSPANGWWTLGLYWGRCQANANPPVILPLSKEPQKVGVLVDYEGGLVSFYNVDTRALIYSFTGCAFTESAPFRYNLSGFKIYTSTREKTKIYPLFRPSLEEGSDSCFLQITPVHRTKGK